MAQSQDILEGAFKKEFDQSKRILSFDEYLSLIGESPKKQLRSSAGYLLDMIEHFGKSPVLKPGYQNPNSNEATLFRYHVFDQTFIDSARRVVGQELVQGAIVRSLTTFVRQGYNNKLILLHGPNGSAKSSIVQALLRGMEKYSTLPDGALYTFNWIFPVDKVVKGSIGVHSYNASPKDAMASFAKLEDEDVAARLTCDYRDHPILIIPSQQRLQVLEKIMGAEKAREIWTSLSTHHKSGELCHRCRLVFDALLTAHHGDFKKVLQHVQVERVFFSQRYRKGLVTIEPQMHVDAQYQQLTMTKNVANLPASLQGLNLFTVHGDLIDANRGIVEYSDLLKRPIDSFKYLLMVCESGAVNIGQSIAYLDTVMIGSSNELQLDAFKEFPDFTSFKARIELVRVPYLLSFNEEMQIYNHEITQMGAEKHISPHTSWAVALWSVLTRLKKPNSINYSPTVSATVSHLTPLEKAKIYDTGEFPHHLSAEDKKLLKSSIRKLREEYSNIPFYEGRIGASAREIKTVLYNALQNTEYHCLSPLATFREIEDLVKRASEYEFLRQDIKEGYHDTSEFIQTVKNEYISKIDREVRDCIGLYDSNQWEDFLKKYVLHISLMIKKEKLKNPITGAIEDPDLSLINEFEGIIKAPEGQVEKDLFRQSIIAQVGAWSLDNVNQPVVYSQVFPEFWFQLEKHYYESQKTLLTKMHNALIVYDKDPNKGLISATNSDEGAKLARQTVENMTQKKGYCPHCAKEVITFLIKSRY